MCVCVTEFIPLFYFSKHPSNTLQTPCNTLQTPLKHPSTPFKQPSKSSLFFGGTRGGHHLMKWFHKKYFFSSRLTPSLRGPHPKKRESLILLYNKEKNAFSMKESFPKEIKTQNIYISIRSGHISYFSFFTLTLFCLNFLHWKVRKFTTKLPRDKTA